jgi:aryl-alcohol dehydrogenase-like predicted oxidoreductase
MDSQDRINLGKTGIIISTIGAGTWQWGDQMLWQYGKSHSESDIKEAFLSSVGSGVNFFDSAESYGMGASERHLGKYIQEQRIEFENTKLIVATKMFPFPWRLAKKDVIRAARRSLQRLGIQSIDLFQMHFPTPPIPIETWMDGMANALESGLIRAVGVSNYSIEQMVRAQNALSKREIPLASNQVIFNLLNRSVEKNGLLDKCVENGITLIAYSPLGKGMLTGTYTPENLPPGLRGRMYSPNYIQRIQPLLGLMREIGAGHNNKTITQVALNWVISKGAVAIPGAKNPRQALDNAGAMGWRLTPDEVSALDHASDLVNQKK